MQSWFKESSKLHLNHVLVTKRSHILKQTCSWKLQIFIFFFLPGFSFTDTDISHDSGGRQGTIFYSTLPLPPAHKHSDIYLQLCMWDDYHIFLTAPLVFIRLLNLWELPYYQITIWLIDDVMLIFVCLLEDLIFQHQWSCYE